MLNTSYPYYPVADADAIILLMLLLVSFNTDYVDNEVCPCIVYISYTQSRVHKIKGPRLLVIKQQTIESRGCVLSNVSTKNEMILLNQYLPFDIANGNVAHTYIVSKWECIT